MYVYIEGQISSIVVPLIFNINSARVNEYLTYLKSPSLNLFYTVYMRHISVFKTVDHSSRDTY